jgi:regulator of replication initiation timing
MIRELWAKIGRRKGRSEKYPDKANPEQSVVPLRGTRSAGISDFPETAIVSKKDHVERFTDAIQQMVEKLEGIGGHLGKQISQNERLLDQMTKLPELLNSLPQSIGRQEEALRGLLGQLLEKERRDRQILDTLSSLPEQAACQSQALEEIRQQMAQSLQSDSQLNKQVGQVCDTLAKLDQDTISQTEWMEQVCRTFTLTDRHLKLTLARQHRRFLWMAAITRGLCRVLVSGLAVWIFLMHRG